MNIAPASVISARGVVAAAAEQDEEDQRGLEKISLNAAKNWHQNSGAKRLDSSSSGGMAARISQNDAGDAA